MQVLELVHRLELDHVQAVRQDAVRLALEQVLALISRNMRYGREYICAMR